MNTLSRRNEVREMCRNIKVLYNFEPPATADEMHSAALQYVRKVSGFAKPSEANTAAFERAVDEIATATETLMDSLVTTRPPRNREAEAAKAHARALERFGAVRPPADAASGIR